MSDMNNGGPAFPDSVAVGPAGDVYGSTGMALRDYFAAKALPAILAQDENGITNLSPGATFAHGRTAAQEWAAQAYEIADAMLAVRSK